MNVKETKTSTYWPGTDDILEHPQLNPTEKLIVFAYISFFNPWKMYQKNPTYRDIADKLKISISSVKRLVPQILDKLPDYFQGRTRDFSDGYKYNFKMSLRETKETIVTSPVNTSSNFIGDTSYTEDDLQKMKILQLLGFEPSKVTRFLIYSLPEIKIRVEYLLQQFKKKRMEPDKKHLRHPVHFNYVIKCFEDQWVFKSMTNKERRELAYAMDSRLDAVASEITSKMSMKGAA